LDVRQGETVFINDSLLFGNEEPVVAAVPKRSKAKVVPLKFYTTLPQVPLAYSSPPEAAKEDIVITSEFIVEASTAEFGQDLDQERLASHNATVANSFAVAGAHLIRFPDNPLGCLPFNDTSGRIQNALVFVQRGDCLFIEKLANARRAGALGVIVWHDTEDRLNPSADPEDYERYGPEVQDGVIAVIPATAASFVSGRLQLEEQNPEKTIVMVSLEKEWPEQLLGEDPSLRTEPTKTERTSGRILYINGHPMINTELLF
jgi:mannosidase alpha-like ER degradation enhancer 1